MPGASSAAERIEADHLFPDVAGHGSRDSSLVMLRGGRSWPNTGPPPAGARSAVVLMDWDRLREPYRLAERVTGVLHCGAHLAEEAPEYDEAFGPDVPVWWVEGNPAVFDKLTAALSPYPNRHLIRALLADVDGDLRDFHVTNKDGMSSSVLEFGTHATLHPDTVFVEHLTLPTRTVDSLIAEHQITGVNLLVMDLQGAEGLCLAGASGLLASLDFVMSEVNESEVYVGTVMVDELDRILADLERTETQ